MVAFTIVSSFTKQVYKAESDVQIWNVNRYNGMVGVFNLQGSSWSRTRRQFVIHDATPPSLTTVVKPADIPLLSSSSAHTPDQLALNGSAVAAESTHGNGAHDSVPKGNGALAKVSKGSGAEEFVAFCNATQQLVQLGWHEGIEVALAGIQKAKRLCSAAVAAFCCLQKRQV